MYYIIYIYIYIIYLYIYIYILLYYYIIILLVYYIIILIYYYISYIIYHCIISHTIDRTIYHISYIINHIYHISFIYHIFLQALLCIRVRLIRSGESSGSRHEDPINAVDGLASMALSDEYDMIYDIWHNRTV